MSLSSLCCQPISGTCICRYSELPPSALLYQALSYPKLLKTLAPLPIQSQDISQVPDVSPSENLRPSIRLLEWLVAIALGSLTPLTSPLMGFHTHTHTHTHTHIHTHVCNCCFFCDTISSMIAWIIAVFVHPQSVAHKRCFKSICYMTSSSNEAWAYNTMISAQTL